MKKVLVLITGFVISLISYGQSLEVGDYSSGYKSSGIFDTVKAIILIDNKVLKSIQRIEGYGIREWNIWSGGCDPYINPGYHPEADRWIETGVFLYAKKKKQIKEKIWQSELLADTYEPIPKKKQVIEKISSINPDLQNTLETLTLLDTANLVITGYPVLTLPTTVTFFTGSDSTNGSYFHYDTIKVLLYVDISKNPLVLKLKKIEGYEIVQTFLYKSPEYIYTDDKMKKLDYHIKVIKAIQDPEVIGNY